MKQEVSRTVKRLLTKWVRCFGTPRLDIFHMKSLKGFQCVFVVGNMPTYWSCSREQLSTPKRLFKTPPLVIVVYLNSFSWIRTKSVVSRFHGTFSRILKLSYFVETHFQFLVDDKKCFKYDWYLPQILNKQSNPQINLHRLYLSYLNQLIPS